MTPLATITDLEDRLGAPVPPDLASQAYARLRDASAIVRAYAGVSWVDESGDLDDVPDAVAGVVASMVERATRNPAGVTQETAGPFNRSFGAVAAERLYMTKAERMVVRSAAGRSSIGTLSTTRGEIETADVVVGIFDEGLM